MTKGNSVPKRQLHWFLKAIIMIAAILVIFVVSLGVILAWILGKPDTRFTFSDYEELRNFSIDSGEKSDAASLPLFVGVSAKNFWHDDYAGNIPMLFQRDHFMVAENTDGFTDLVFLGLFKLDEASTRSMNAELRKMFSRTEVGTQGNAYAENALCLNHVGMGPWAIKEDQLDNFFDFCLNFRNSNKTLWELVLPEEKQSEFKYIKITEYEGSNYFTVAHGGS